MTLTALVIGAISRDLDLSATSADARSTIGSTADGRPESPGGVVHHAGLALARLGARTRVITLANPRDEGLLKPLRDAGVEVTLRPSVTTTCCANDYSGEEDRHELRAVSEPIRPAHVPDGWRDADLIQLGPLHPDDLAIETAECVRGLRGLDVQGLVRRPRGEPGPHPELGRFLASADVVKASESELERILAGESLRSFVARHAIRELLITRGARGATVVVDGDSKELAIQPVRGGSAIGAGDVFLAAHLWLRVRGRSPLQAARGAAMLAASKIRDGELAADLPEALLAGRLA